MNTLTKMTEAILAFRDARDWKQFHNPKDAAISLTLEANELLEFMQWRNGEELKSHLAKHSEGVGDELADVLYWTLLLAHDQGIDLEAAFERKMAKNAAKYPVEQARGSSLKYHELKRASRVKEGE